MAIDMCDALQISLFVRCAFVEMSVISPFELNGLCMHLVGWVSNPLFSCLMVLTCGFAFGNKPTETLARISPL